MDETKLAALGFLVSLRNSNSSAAGLDLDECGKLFCDSCDDLPEKLDSVIEVTWRPYFSIIGALKWKQWFVDGSWLYGRSMKMHICLLLNLCGIL